MTAQNSMGCLHCGESEGGVNRGYVDEGGEKNGGIAVRISRRSLEGIRGAENAGGG